MTIRDLAIELGLTPRELMGRLWDLGVVLSDKDAELEAAIEAEARTRWPAAERPPAPADSPEAPAGPSAPNDPESSSPQLPQYVRPDQRETRVYELAARYKVEPSLIQDRLARLGFEAADHLAWLSAPHVEALEADFATNPPRSVVTERVDSGVRRRRKLR